MKSTLILVAAMAVFGLAPTGAQAPAADPFDGTWKLNVAKSTFLSGPAPPATTTDVRVFSTIDGGWHVFLLSAVNALGDPIMQIVTYKPDEKPYPVYNAATLAAYLATGKRPNVTRSYRRVDAHSMEFTTYTGGVAGVPSQRVVSSDGKTYTQTVQATNAAGQLVRNVTVFDRVR